MALGSRWTPCDIHRCNRAEIGRRDKENEDGKKVAGESDRRLSAASAHSVKRERRTVKLVGFVSEREILDTFCFCRRVTKLLRKTEVHYALPFTTVIQIGLENWFDCNKGFKSRVGIRWNRISDAGSDYPIQAAVFDDETNIENFFEYCKEITGNSELGRACTWHY